jgi:hypothetical protein
MLTWDDILPIKSTITRDTKTGNVTLVVINPPANVERPVRGFDEAGIAKLVNPTLATNQI